MHAFRLTVIRPILVLAPLGVLDVAPGTGRPGLGSGRHGFLDENIGS